MRFLIISHVLHTQKAEAYFGYGPFIREMNLWIKSVEVVEVIAPLIDKNPDPIDLAYATKTLKFIQVPAIAFTTFSKSISSLFVLPRIIFKMQKAMRVADHIHLRCPGNMGLIGCVVQIFFPSKAKSAKYAGNWDPESDQPITYKLQKWILSNTFLTKNMNVLVYGKWPNQSKNIKPFFTATYREREIIDVAKDFAQPLHALFVGTLNDNKRPLETVQFIKLLREQGIDISLEIFGDGLAMENIKRYKKDNDIDHKIVLRGNQPAEVVQEAYKKAHIVFLLSKSEGWPKAVAEAMFWGAIPVATPVSCVPWMLNSGKRGFLLEDWNRDAAITLALNLEQVGQLEEMSKNAQNWSQQYTLDSFENALKELI